MPIPHQPIPEYIPPFSFEELEAKGRDYLARVKAEARQIADQARNEVAKLRQSAAAEIQSTRKQLDALKQKLRDEKAKLEADIVSQKQNIVQNEETARKKGYDEGFAAGYEEGKKKGYGDGELQANVDHADKLHNEVQVHLGTKIETMIPALRGMVKQLESSKQDFMLRWEETAVHVAAAIAERTIQSQLPKLPDVPLKLLREVLELGAGSTQARVRLNPNDYETLKPQAKMLIDEMSGVAKTELIADHRISPGGCVLETSLGIIDNRIEARLQRIKDELTNT